MKAYLRICLGLLVLFIAPSFTGAQTPEAQLKHQLRAYTDAFVARDIDRLIGLMPPQIADAMGGREAARSFHQGVFAFLNSSGMEFRSITLADPSPIVVEGRESFAIVPTTLQATSNGGPATINDYIVAISNDGGARWGFINGCGPIERILRSYPKVAYSLTIPVRRMTIISKDSNLRIESVYKDGQWVPTEETRRALEKILKGAGY